MLKLLHILKKEFKLVFRDIHSVAVLFVMPAFFILIMSLAMQSAFEAKHQPLIGLALENYSQNVLVKNLIEDLRNVNNISVVFKRSLTEKGYLKNNIFKNDAFQFALIFDQDDAARDQNSVETPIMHLFVNPAVSPQTLAIFQHTLRLLLLKNKMLVLEKQLPAFTKNIFQSMETTLPEPTYLDQKGNAGKPPTSAQQNVPAWLIFAMFFISIPISTIFINEKACGTYARLKSMNVSYAAILLGKTMPYFIINQIQMFLMILVGVYLLPLFGGTALEITGSLPGLLMMSTAVSLAAISFALLISSISKTTAEASTLGGVSNLLLGALGGIMVPKFLMPKFMQLFSAVSPMSWGLEGFLDIMLRGGTLFDVFPEAVMLLFFSSICLTITVLVLRKNTDG